MGTNGLPGTGVMFVASKLGVGKKITVSAAAMKFDNEEANSKKAGTFQVPRKMGFMVDSYLLGP